LEKSSIDLFIVEKLEEYTYSRRLKHTIEVSLLKSQTGMESFLII